MKTDARMISKLFFGLLPVQILLVAVGSINSLIDGAMAGRYIGPADCYPATASFSREKPRA